MLIFHLFVYPRVRPGILKWRRSKKISLRPSEISAPAVLIRASVYDRRNRRKSYSSCSRVSEKARFLQGYAKFSAVAKLPMNNILNSSDNIQLNCNSSQTSRRLTCSIKGIQLITICIDDSASRGHKPVITETVAELA